MEATSRNSIESVTLLLKYGADVTLKINQRSVLQMALNRTNLNIFKLLLNSKNNDKSCTLMMIIYSTAQESIHRPSISY